MEDIIRELLIKYGPREIHSCLEQVCRNLYEELSLLYGQQQKYQPQNVIIPIDSHRPSQLQQVEELPTQPLIKEIILPKRIIKKKQIVVESPVEEPNKEEPVQPIAQEPPSASQESPKNPRKEMKDNHRAAVRKKYEELIAQGIEPLTLLTKANLEKWLKGGLSYQRIARDHVGLHEATISRIAHEQGLESQVKRHEVLKWLNKK